MSDESLAFLHELARAAGISVEWKDARGNHHTVSPEVLRNVLSALDLPAETPAQMAASLDRLHAPDTGTDSNLIIGVVRQSMELPVPSTVPTLHFRVEFDTGGVVDGDAKRKDDSTIVVPGINLPGYHRIVIGDRHFTLAVAPQRCFSMADATGKSHPREWALAVQLYGLRRRGGLLAAPGGSGGIGDFTALGELGRVAAKRGAAALAISPVHAMFSADPSRFSPYGPSSRLFINVLHIDPAEVFGQPAVALAISALGLSQEIVRLERLDLIDWPAAARAKLAVLRRLFDGFPANVGSSVHEEFLRFRSEGGATLEDHARFEALHAWQVADGSGSSGWRQWPEAYQDPASEAVATFSEKHAVEVSFHAFLQWLADRGMARAQSAAREAGMSIGLISDLAVGTDPSGSHAWSRQDEILARLSPGAPPDVYNPHGQAWGITAFSPSAMKRNGYRAFIEMLRASLRHAGGIRIDHALGLSRMWLVPEGASPRDGAYVNYPFEDMMRLVALESWRLRTVVIGENLGTVPDGFNDRIAEAGMLGMQVMWFERQHWGDNAPFKPPAQWSPESVGMTTTHDLPTIAGWWVGRDLEWRAKLGLFAEGASQEAQWRVRERDREQLIHALHAAGVGAGALDASSAQAPVAPIFEFIGAANCPLVIVPLEDVLALEEQPNLPGTIDTHPNWRRRIAVPVEQLLDDKQVDQRLDSLLQARTQS